MSRFKVEHKGDDGYTHTRTGRLPKDSPIIDFIGEIDELVSLIGVIKVYLKQRGFSGDIITRLETFQQHLLSVASYAVAGQEEQPIGPQQLAELETWIDELWRSLQATHRFKGLIAPGASLESALLNLARAVCRRVERRGAKLLRERILAPSAYAYMNRLSDALYVLALYLDNVNTSKLSSS